MGVFQTLKERVVEKSGPSLVSFGSRAGTQPNSTHSVPAERNVMSTYAQPKRIIRIFVVLFIGIGVENQCHMLSQLEAYRNDAYIYRLRETIQIEFHSFTRHRPNALDVRAENSHTLLKEILDRVDLPPPETLQIVDGPAGTGRMMGLGHPFLGGEAQDVVWRLAAGIPGGSLEIEAVPETAPP